MKSTYHTLHEISHGLPLESETTTGCSLIILVLNVQDMLFLSAIDKFPWYTYCTGHRQVLQLIDINLAVYVCQEIPVKASINWQVAAHGKLWELTS